MFCAFLSEFSFALLTGLVSGFIASFFVLGLSRFLDCQQRLYAGIHEARMNVAVLEQNTTYHIDLAKLAELFRQSSDTLDYLGP